MVVPTFTWLESIPSGHRNLHSETSIIGKAVDSMSLVYEDGSVIDLFDDTELTEIERYTLITGAFGVFSGTRHTMPGAFTCSAALNAPSALKPDVIRNDGKYKGAMVEVAWKSDSKNSIICDVADLMDLVMLHSHILVESEFDFTEEDEPPPRTGSTRSKKVVTYDQADKEALRRKV